MKNSIEVLDDHILRIDKIVETNNINAGYKHFINHVLDIEKSIKEMDEVNIDSSTLTAGNIYVSLAKNIIQAQNAVLSTYINFQYLKRYMEEKGIETIKISDAITLELSNFDDNELVQDCKKIINTLNVETLELDVIEENLIKDSEQIKELNESTTDSKSK